jgi:predicted NUDIX family phosphoesterase
MTKEEARAKYGDNKVMVVNRNFVTQIMKYANRTDVATMMLNSAMVPMLRREAEFDPRYLQVIPYIIATSDEGDITRIYLIRRKAGDDRLTGRCAIGVGGHIEDGEKIVDGMFRELREELSLAPEEYKIFDDTHFAAPQKHEDFIIFDESSEVNSVHLGLVYIIHVNIPEDVIIGEPEKLEGVWITIPELEQCLNEGKLESWSEIVARRLFIKEEGDENAADPEE